MNDVELIDCLCGLVGTLAGLVKRQELAIREAVAVGVMADDFGAERESVEALIGRLRKAGYIITYSVEEE